MKILKVGRAHDEWKREFECRNCGSVLEIHKSDLYLTNEWDIGGNRDQVAAECCVCKNEIIIDDPARDDWGELPKKQDH